MLITNCFCEQHIFAKYQDLKLTEALGALNGATRRLRKTKSGFLSTTFLVSPLLYLFGLPNLPAKVSN